MFQDLADWFEENWKAFSISISVACLIILLIISIVPSSFKNGYIISKLHEDRKEWNTEEEERIYRTESYLSTETYTDSNGNRRTRPVTKYRNVYDHTDIVTYHYDDDEDFIVIVKSNDNKAGYNWWQKTFDKDRPINEFKFFIEKEIWNSMGIEREFVSKEIKHWDNDRITKTEIERRRKGW